jgi:hypothetical protein
VVHVGTSFVVSAVIVAVGGLVMSGPAGAGSSGSPYEEEITRWRQAREERLKSPTGWLSLAGLSWLKEGENTFGTDARADVVLPVGSVPARAGVIVLKAGKIMATLADGVAATLAGKPVKVTELHHDVPGPPDVLSFGPVTLQPILRGGTRYGIRVRDVNNPARRDFTGLRWFPIRVELKVAARFVPRETPLSITVPSVVGPPQVLSSPGTAVFAIGGRDVRLDAVLDEPDATELFFIFRDQTAGKETYGGGRFLYTPLARDGQVVLDFNKAFSPPCAYSSWATCPLPPPQNRLAVRIEAGELAPPSDSHPASHP